MKFHLHSFQFPYFKCLRRPLWINYNFLNNGSNGAKFRFFARRKNIHLVQHSQIWVGDMKKFFGVYLVLLCRYVNAESFNQFFEKLDKEKISSHSKCYEKLSIFQCFNNCKKTPGCKIFNVNSRRHICQLTD